MNSKVCREKRADILKQMEGLADKIKTEKRQFNEEERSSFDMLDKEQERLLASAEDFERVERFQGLSLDESRNQIRTQSNRPSRPFNDTEERNKAYAGWFFHGSKYQKREYWQAAERHEIDVTSPHLHLDWKKSEERSYNVVGTASAGGDLVAVDNQLMKSIDVALKAFGGIRKVATVVRTPTGANLPWPLNDDTGNQATLDAEASSLSDLALTLGQNVLNAYRYDSGFVKVSWELMNDSVIDLASFIGRQMGIRIGRKTEYDFANGSGSGQPNGLITNATSGTTSTTNSAISYADLLNLYHSVDPLYRESPNCCWMMHDSTFHVIRAAVDGNGRPLVYSSLEGISEQGENYSLLGKRLIVNNSFPSFAASAKAITFGDHAKYILRDVGGEDGGMNLIRLNERFADLGLVAFLGWSRHDGMLSDAGQHPVKYMAIHS